MAVNKYENILTNDEISFLLNNDVVLSKRNDLEFSQKVKFSIELTDELKNSIKTNLGLDLSKVLSVPMRWVKGDSLPHIDRGESEFSKTYLIYLTDSKGSFVIDRNSYSIHKGDAFVFNEGLSHETIGTGEDERLLIGPMSEFGFPVGVDPITYYQSLFNAENNIDPHIDSAGSSFVVANNSALSPSPFPNYNGSWIIYTPIGLRGTTVYPGQPLDSSSTYVLYTSPPCFLEGTKILCKVDEKSDEKYLPIQLLEKGMLVKTQLDGYKKIDMIGYTKFYNPGNVGGRPPNCLYRCCINNFKDLFEDLYITGYHSILVDDITHKQRKQTEEILGKVYITGNKYRLIACVDQRTELWDFVGLCNIWHLALENEDYYKNYGIYANGLLVETTSKRYLKELSGMKLKN